MTEDIPLQDEFSPVSEPIATTGIPETDKKRVMIGSAIGGGIFLGVLVAIIVLVSTESPKPKPPNPPKPSVLPHYNPYYVEAESQENRRLKKITIRNHRQALENGTKYYSDSFGYIPIVKADDNNYEPELLQVYVLEYDEHFARIYYDDPIIDRWDVTYFGNQSDPYAYASEYTYNPKGFALYENVNNSFQWYFMSNRSKITPLVDTHSCRFQYFDKYIEFEALLDRDYIYGMGERMESFHLLNDNYTLWNRFFPYDYGGDTEYGMYGSHPFILNRLTESQRQDFLGIFMRNSNAMMFSMWDHGANGTTVNYKMLGGVIDLFIFHTGDPQYILRKYHSVIGRPYLPPVWSMGLQQAREKYTLKDFEEVMKGYQDNDIPVDALWADTELNEGSKTFTVNKGSFSGIKEFVKKLHDPIEGIDMYFVAVANPALAKDNDYKYYLEAIKEDCLIRSTFREGKPFEGKTAAGISVWLDFYMHESTLIWAGGLHDLHELTSFDGIWIYDNEITHSCNGECDPILVNAENSIPNPNHKTTEFDYIPYRPTTDPLDADTLHMTAYHAGDEVYHKQYFTHNLFSIQISQATYESLYGIFESKRFFIASRSTWPGCGQFASHWLANNYATWQSMIYSISGVLNFNMFGIPHVGAPIGGFYFNASDELLVRWYSLGAFYPLMLSHSSSNANRKEAYMVTKYKEEIQRALYERYCLIRFMYTKMFEAHFWGGAVVHPVFFDFTNDTELYKREIVDRTFMWSNTLYIVPALIEHQTIVEAYLPNWRWYDLKTFDLVNSYSPHDEKGRYHKFEQPLGYTTILIKGGSILPYQEFAKAAKVMNTRDLEVLPARLIVAPDHTGRALGSMVVDLEGTRPYPDPRSNTYRHYTFTYMNQIFRVNKLAGFDFHIPDKRYEFDDFWEVVILDNFGKTQVDFVCMMDSHLRKRDLVADAYIKGHVLTITDKQMKKLSLGIVESIVWGSNSEQNFCQNQVHIEEMKLSDNERVLTARLATSDPDAFRIEYDLSASALTDHTVYLEIKRVGAIEWRVPDVVDSKIKKPTTKKTLDGVGFGVAKPNQDFFFEVSEEADPHDFLVTTRNQPFVYVKSFIHIKFMVAGRHIFGLGERVGRFELADGIYSLWNYDTMQQESGSPPGNNMYGFHPFYMIHTHNPMEFAGVFFLTSNPMDVRIKHISIQTEIDHILTGGIIELFIISETTAETVIREYHNIIGKPIPLPFWAFGYHQSRWGYRDLDHLKLVVRRFNEENIPLDGVWMDKDFMDKYQSFTIDNKRWAGLKAFINELHNNHKHFVAIVDAGVAIDTNYDIYNKGMTSDVFLKSNDTKEPLVGITWAGYSVWIDFLHPTAASFWTDILTQFHDRVNFDALWLDMNEPSNFCDGECPDQATYHYYYFPLDYYDDLYYNPTHRPLESRTISIEAIHYGSSDLRSEFNLHAMYGFYQSRVTSQFFTGKLKKRPFVVSSSTFPGSGRYVTHWLGDNHSTWNDMEHSIAGMIHFSMFGIPFTGANICGYTGNATDTLCARWMQLGAFYPFMRNHNSPEGSPQEPYENPVVKTASRHAILTRYTIVRYLYTSYMHTVLRGGPLVMPLTFLFPEDNDTYTTVDSSFMLGPALRITPILEDGKDKVESYFPNADWYVLSHPSYEKTLSFDSTARKGKIKTVHSGLSGDTLNVHIREGQIIPIQETSEGMQNVLQLHNRTINLLVVPDHVRNAKGSVFYDSEDCDDYLTEHQDIEMTLYSNQITFNVTSGKELKSYNKTDKFVSKIIILGAEPYQKTRSSEYETTSGQTVQMKPPVYDAKYKTLILQAIDNESMNVLEVKKIIWKE